MKTDKLTDLIIDIPMKLCRNMNKKFVNTTLTEIEVNISQHHIMVLKLLDENSSMCVSEIVEKLSIPKSQMTATIDKLVEMNYVDRYNDNSDRRKVMLKITKNGKLITHKTIRLLNERIEKHIKQLKESEYSKLVDGIELLFKFCEKYK